MTSQEGLPCAKCYTRENITMYTHGRKYYSGSDVKSGTFGGARVTQTSDIYTVRIPLCKSCKIEFEEWNKKYKLLNILFPLLFLFILLDIAGLLLGVDVTSLAFIFVLMILLLILIPLTLFSFYYRMHMLRSRKSNYSFVPITRIGEISVKPLY